jgi:hypothetical protein
MRRENWSQASGIGRQRPAVRAARWGFLVAALALPLCAQPQTPTAPPAAPPPAAAAPAGDQKGTTAGQPAASPAPTPPAAAPNATPSPVQPPVGEAPLATQIEQAKMGIEPPPPPPPETDWFSGYVDFGYRWVTGPGGNFQEYRSVVNLGDGPKLFGADFTIQDPKKRLFDVLTVRGIGWGDDPYTTAYVGARKQKLYDFRFDYRSFALFDAVPTFANPNSPLGFDEQSFDTRQRTASFELDLFPASRIIPYLAYDHYSVGGGGIDDWVVGASNNFPVPFVTNSKTNNYRGGVNIELNRFHLTLEQGGSTFREDDSTNFTGTSFGDNLSSGNVLTSLQQAYGIRGSSIYTKGLLTANPVNWINFYGQFLYSQPRNTVNYTELSGGSFVNFATLMMYGAEFGMATGNVVQPHIGGLGGFQMYLGKRARIIETVTFNREHNSAFSSFDTQFLQSLTTPTLLSATLTLANPFQVVNNQETQTDVYYDVTKNLTLRGGFRYMWGDATVFASTLSQTGPFATGSLSRVVGIGGFIFHWNQKLRVTADYEGSSSDDIYFRTSLNNYSKGRILAKYQATNSLLLTSNFQILSNGNPSPTVQLDFLGKDNSLAFFWTPKAGKRLTFTGQYNRSTVRSSILYLNLPTFGTAVSSYRDNAHTATAAVEVALPRGGTLRAGGSFIIANGSRPTSYYEPNAQLLVPVRKHLSWNTVWQYYGYGENFFMFEGFRSHIVQTGLRLSR